MKNPAIHQTETTYLPILSSQNQGWENILVEQFQQSPGEASCHYSDEHTIYLSLASRPIRLLQIQRGKTYEALYGKGDISITPAKPRFLLDGMEMTTTCRFGLHLVLSKTLLEKP